MKFGRRELERIKEMIPDAKRRRRASPQMWAIQITECARRNGECNGELEERNSAKGGDAVKCIFKGVKLRKRERQREGGVAEVIWLIMKINCEHAYLLRNSRVSCNSKEAPAVWGRRTGGNGGVAWCGRN